MQLAAPPTEASVCNLVEAHRLLDEIGMDARDSDGYRLAPNEARLPDRAPVFESRQWQLGYNTNGVDGEEPPDEAKTICDIHSRMIEAVPDSPESEQVIADLYRWYAEYVLFFIPLGHARNPVIATLQCAQHCLCGAHSVVLAVLKRRAFLLL